MDKSLERRTSLASITSSIQTPYVIPELVEADLDQLYFERVHPLIPVLQRTRYFTWAKGPSKSDSRIALQYAMWTLTASLSTHCQSIRDSLYTHTKRTLKNKLKHGSY
ncbi:hypothetical protein UA08_06875 [Talaromyces atroroseus]|uniref:Transcription factor domain-containing protein n=1 Tax=Talaromyces atroroseus TaxID=1441469 RepID=A0A225AFM2_TALAT|nr:hypothetical protein UA08_06875 [Talaromyces atroroseus]OKL57933.1 hypothetical protein UA08_06875 [Talaromyces atroroseus]